MALYSELAVDGERDERLSVEEILDGYTWVNTVDDLTGVASLQARAAALYWQGHATWTTGFTARPQFSNQTEVFSLLQSHLMDGKGLHVLPAINFK